MTPAESALHEAARAETARLYGRTQRQVDADASEVRLEQMRDRVARVEHRAPVLRVVRDEQAS